MTRLFYYTFVTLILPVFHTSSSASVQVLSRYERKIVKLFVFCHWAHLNLWIYHGFTVFLSYSLVWYLDAHRDKWSFVLPDSDCLQLCVCGLLYYHPTIILLAIGTQDCVRIRFRHLSVASGCMYSSSSDSGSLWIYMWHLQLAFLR